MMPRKKMTPKTDSERETRVLLEQISQSVQTVAEQHGNIVKKLEEHGEDLTMIKSDLNTVKMVLKGLDTGLGTVQLSLKGVEKKLDETISQNDQRFKKVEVKLETMGSSKNV